MTVPRTRAHATAATVVAAGLGIGALTGCGDATAAGAGAGGGSLDGRSFVSTTIAPPLEPGTRLQLGFDGDQIGMHAGCNHLFGSYTVGDGRLRVTSVGGTEMACAEPLMQQDAWLTDFLTAGPSYRLAGDTLTLTGGARTVELVDEEAAIPDQTLTGTEWVLDGIAAGSTETGVISSVPDGVHSTLRFSERRLTAELGCNSGGGTLTVTDSTLKVHRFGQTLTGCAGRKDQVERTVAGVLQAGEIGYVLDGQTLTLRSGATGLIYHSDR